MDMQVVWADRGCPLDLEPGTGRDELPALVALSRGGSLAVSAPSASLWLVLRGEAEIECREGRFALASGQWLLLERDACPAVYAGMQALVVGVALGGDMQAQLHQSAQVAVFPGRGEVGAGVRATVFGLWRRCAAFARNESRLRDVDRQAFGQVLRLLAGLQQGYRGLVDRCPGRSLRRKRQVFSRMQRARLYLEGNLGRAVRITELAELSNVSVWYFTKTFHALYGEGPQAASARLRLQHASTLLRQTRQSVSEVGAACGFENNCSFSRAFRAQFGVPPSLYRLREPEMPTDAANTAGRHRQAVAGIAP